jgi:Flp pilus assembly CpaE family ATPase
MLDLELHFMALHALERIESVDERILTGLVMKEKTGVEILAGPFDVPMKPEQRQRLTLEVFARLVEVADRVFDFVVVDRCVLCGRSCLWRSQGSTSWG